MIPSPKPGVLKLSLALAAVAMALGGVSPVARAEDRPAAGQGGAVPTEPGQGALPGKDGKATADAKKAKPPQPDTPEQRARLLSDLYAHLATADNASDAAHITDAIERLWAFSGSATIDVLMERAAAAAAAKNNELALKLLDAVVDLAPDFAEGWNRRAYVYYTMNDYERALGDLRRAVALEPNHFKAIEGIAQIFKETGRKKAALKAYQELLQINPNASDVREAVKELTRDVEGQGI